MIRAIRVVAGFALAASLLTAFGQPSQESMQARAGKPLDASGLRILIGETVCAYHRLDLGLVRADHVLKSHLLEVSNPYLWTGLVAFRMRSVQLGNVDMGGSPLDQAIERAIGLGSNVWEAHWVAGRARMSQGRYVEARLHLAQARRLGAPVSAMALADAELLVARGDFSVAEEVLEGATRAGEAAYFYSGTLNIWRGLALRAQGRIDDAISAFRAADSEITEREPNCRYSAQLGLAESLVLYKGATTEAELLLERNKAVAGNHRFAQLKDLLPYVKYVNGSTLGRAILSPEEAALELSKYPVGARLLPAMFKVGLLRDVNARDGHGNSLLLLAAFASRADVARWLIASGASVNQSNASGERALGIFCRQGSVEGVRAVLDANGLVNYRTQRGVSPLSEAVASGNQEIAKLILSKSTLTGMADIDSVLVQAAYAGMKDVVIELVARGASVTKVRDGAIPPLIAAILSGNRDLVSWMLNRKADPSLRFLGRSAVDIARESGDSEMVRIITSGGVRSI